MPGPNLKRSNHGCAPWISAREGEFHGRHGNMFYQVRIPPKQRAYLKFLWWKNTNTREDIINLEMYVCGGTLSPSCSNYALRRTAADNERQFGS